MPPTHHPSQSPNSPSQRPLQPQPQSAPTTSPPPDPFSPLFTLLTSHSTSPPTTHHPTIHYLFSDDPTDQLTSAALSTLEAPSSAEHFLIIDLDASGTKVTNAQSMSPDWAVTGADVGAAPTWGEGGGEGGLMLRVEGVGKTQEKGMGIGDVGVEEMEGLVERFQRGMERLRRVVEVGWDDGKGEGEGKAVGEEKGA